MKYTIYTLGNPERQDRIAGIRNAMSGHEEVFIECVNGKDAQQLKTNVERYGFKHPAGMWRPGEAGLWYTNINAWTYAAENDTDLLCFEDDAIPQGIFQEVIARDYLIKPGIDFASLYIPYRNNFQRFGFRLGEQRQEHGNICIYYTARGAKRILSLLKSNGLRWPVDLWLFKQGADGLLVGQSPTVTSTVIVEHDFDLPTNIHNDERIPTDAV